MRLTRKTGRDINQDSAGPIKREQTAGANKTI